MHRGAISRRGPSARGRAAPAPGRSETAPCRPSLVQVLFGDGGWIPWRAPKDPPKAAMGWRWPEGRGGWRWPGGRGGWRRPKGRGRWRRAAGLGPRGAGLPSSLAQDLRSPEGRADHGLPAAGGMSGEPPLAAAPSERASRVPSTDAGVPVGGEGRFTADMSAAPAILRTSLHLPPGRVRSCGGRNCPKGARTPRTPLRPHPPVAFPHPINSVASSPRVSVATGPLQPISTPTI